MFNRKNLFVLTVFILFIVSLQVISATDDNNSVITSNDSSIDVNESGSVHTDVGTGSHKSLKARSVTKNSAKSLKPTSTSVSYLNTSTVNTRIKVRVKSSDKSTPTGSVRLLYDGKTSSKKLVNGETVFNIQLPYGRQTVTAKYAGSNNYMSSQKTSSVNIHRENTYINVKSSRLITSNTVFKVTLRDTAKRLVKSTSIQVTENGKVLTNNKLVNGTGNIKLVANPGKHKYQFRYIGSSTYNPVTQNKTVYVYKASTIINPQVLRNTPETIVKITVKDNDKQLIKTGQIQITSNNKIIYRYNLKNGVDTIRLNLKEGTRKLTIKYPASKLYKQSTKTITTYITKLNTKLSIKTGNRQTTDTSFSITVKDQNNKPVTTGNLQILENNKIIKNTKIISNNTNISLIQKPGLHRYQFKYQANRNYRQSIQTINTRIYKTNTYTTTNIKTHTTTNTQIQVTVTDTTRKPVTQGQIQVLDNNKQIQKLKLQNSTTIIKLTLSPGKHNITTKYQSNNIYNPSNKTQTLQVTKTTTTPIIKIIKNTINNQTIEVTIQDQYKQKIKTGTITLLQNKKQTQKLNLKNTGQTIINLKQKTPNITIQYHENNQYKQSTKTISLTPQLKTPQQIATYYLLQYKENKNSYIFTDKTQKTTITINKNYTTNTTHIKDAIQIYYEAPTKLKQSPTTITFTKTPPEEKKIGTLGLTNPDKNTIEIYTEVQNKQKNRTGNLRATLYHEMGHALDNKVNNTYSINNKYIEAIESDFIVQLTKGHVVQLSSRYAEEEFNTDGTLSENWAEAVAIVSQTKLSDKQSAVVTNFNGTSINYKQWKEIHPNLYNYTYTKIF